MSESTGYTTAKVVARATPAQEAERAKLFTLADVDPIGRTEAMIVGRPGTGKTVLASTFPAPFRWLAADGPTCIKSLRWAFKAGKTSLARMEDLVAYAPVEEAGTGVYADKPNAFNLMTDMIDYWFSPEHVESWIGGTLVIDSLSEVNDWALNIGLDLNSQLPTPSKPLSGSHSINKKAKLRIVTGKQDYKSAMALMQGFLNDVRVQCSRHNRNLVILCHEYHLYEGTGEDEHLIGIKPYLHGQLRDMIPKSFDDVWYTQVYNGKDFKVQLHADPLRDAKTRWGQLLAKEEPADYRELIKKVRTYHNL